MVEFRSTLLISILLLTLLIAISVDESESTKILMLPINMNSHLMYFTRMAEKLSELGHTVVLLMPSNAQTPTHQANVNLTVLKYPVTEEMPYSHTDETLENLAKMATATSFWERIRRLVVQGRKTSAALESNCVDLLENELLMNQLENSQFQFAIMDPIVPYCNYLLPRSMGIPYASFWVSRVPLVFRVPRLSSFTSGHGCTDEVTFWGRFAAFIRDMFESIYFYNPTNNLAETLVPNRKCILTSSIDLLQRSSLWFYLEDISTGPPLPNMPNTLSVGDIMTGRPIKPLPHTLEAFIEDSEEPVILVSFGSSFERLPDSLIAVFCNTFRRIKYRVIWKLKIIQLVPTLRMSSSIPGSRKTTSWLTQKFVSWSLMVELTVSSKLFTTPNRWYSSPYFWISTTRRTLWPAEDSALRCRWIKSKSRSF